MLKKRIQLKSKNLALITQGSIKGIGREIISKSLENLNLEYPVLIIGRKKDFKEYVSIDSEDEIENIEKGIYVYQPEVKTEESFGFFQKSVEFVEKGIGKAIVTAPISKDEWIKNGVNFKGHTDFFKKRYKDKEIIMSFYSQDLRLSLFTDHIPLKSIFDYLNKDKIKRFIIKLNSYLKNTFKKEFDFYVCGLNPHCGESGAMGDEENDMIMPALNEIRDDVSIKGIFPADTIFVKAIKDKNSYIVCWYHDQGLIGFKTLNFYNGVNLTLGLPFIRTSPDHGTAFDIAGKNIADYNSMLNSIKLAEQLINLKSI